MFLFKWGKIGGERIFAIFGSKSLTDRFCYEKNLCIVAATGGFSLQASAQDKYVPTEENLRNREKFQDDKFGVFIHWGIYSMLGDGEWALELNKLDAKEYAKLASGFYPSKFDAAAWVSAIKNAGAKYITITSRHHDGFSMFDTKYSDYNIVKATPFRPRHHQRAGRRV